MKSFKQWWNTEIFVDTFEEGPHYIKRKDKIVPWLRTLFIIVSLYVIAILIFY